MKPGLNALNIIFTVLIVGWMARAERLQVLLLSYNWPQELNVLQSLLCVEPCTKRNKCPAEYLKYQLDPATPEVFWNDDFVVFKPTKPGHINEMVERYKELSPAFISMSGHHSSGFSGSSRDPFKGTFDLKTIARQVTGKETNKLFGSPSLVTLNGCRTSVTSDFKGDPYEYILHIIDETEIHRDAIERLRSAVSQIGGIEKNYRQIMPNACIMGYEGGSSPGGIAQVYSQYTNIFRAFIDLATLRQKVLKQAKTQGAVNFSVAPIFSLFQGDWKLKEKAIESECKTWPCNLCQENPQYKAMASGLAQYLRQDQERMKLGIPLGEEARTVEKVLEAGGYYRNTKWSCAGNAVAEPTFPMVKEARKIGKLLLQLMFKLSPHSSTPSTREKSELLRELTHMLASHRMEEGEQSELVAFAQQDDNIEKLLSVRSSPDINVYDFYKVVTMLKCSECIAAGINSESEVDAKLAAEAVDIESSLYLDLFDHKFAEVRAAAANKLVPGLGNEIYKKALYDLDVQTRSNAASRLQTVTSDSEYKIQTIELVQDVGVWEIALNTRQPDEVSIAAAARLHPSLDPTVYRMALITKEKPGVRRQATYALVKTHLTREKLKEGLTRSFVPSPEIWKFALDPQNNYYWYYAKSEFAEILNWYGYGYLKDTEERSQLLVLLNAIAKELFNRNTGRTDDENANLLIERYENHLEDALIRFKDLPNDFIEKLRTIDHPSAKRILEKRASNSQ